MTQEELNTMIERLISLTTATPQDKEDMRTVYRELFGAKANFCTSCPGAVRAAMKSIKAHYAKNK